MASVQGTRCVSMARLLLTTCRNFLLEEGIQGSDAVAKKIYLKAMTMIAWCRLNFKDDDKSECDWSVFIRLEPWNGGGGLCVEAKRLYPLSRTSLPPPLSLCVKLYKCHGRLYQRKASNGAIPTVCVHLDYLRGKSRPLDGLHPRHGISMVLELLHITLLTRWRESPRPSVSKWSWGNTG